MEVEIFDIVLSFDTTGSMKRCLDAVRGKMRDMLRTLKTDIPAIRLGVIAHGDYDTDHTYTIKHEDLTDNVERLCRFVTSVKGTGGGHMNNLDEAYELALLYTRTKMSWRPNSNRVLVMIGDCRPHEKNYSLNKQRIDWTLEIIKLRDMNVKINAVQCGHHSYADSFFHKIASATFGQRVTLNNMEEVEKTLMSICYREAGLNLSTKTFVSSALVPSCPYASPLGWQISSEDEGEEVSDEESDEEDDENGMRCPKCKVLKPPNEFPSIVVTSECQHAPLECLRCVVSCASEAGRCPHDGCNVEVAPDNETVKLFQAKLDRMFVDYKEVLKLQEKILRPSGEFLSVSTISGDTEWFPYNSKMKISDLKREIMQKLKLKIEQQKLIYNEDILKGDARLSDYSIGPNANISLIVPLYCIPEHLDHVVFDLSWEFPSVNPDFLDATCMAFEKTDFVQVIDWTHPTNSYYLQDSVKHSEQNLTGPGAKAGHQTIHVYLKRVPSNISHLYFILSSWRSRNLSAFQNPSLRFYEASSQNVNLCETTFKHALNSQAVIMCYAVRAGTKWQIFECGFGSLVEGNSKRYNPIRARISDLINREM